MVCKCCLYNESCLLAWLACVRTITAVISLHCLLVLAGLSRLLLHVACVCQWSCPSCLLAWLACAGTTASLYSLCVSAVQFQSPFPMARMRRHYNQSYLHALLACVGSAVAVASLHGLQYAAAIVTVISLHCLCVVTVPSLLPSPMACVCRHCNPSHLLALQACWQCSLTHLFALLACVGSAVPVATVHCLCGSRKPVMALVHA